MAGIWRPFDTSESANSSSTSKTPQTASKKKERRKFVMALGQFVCFRTSTIPCLSSSVKRNPGVEETSVVKEAWLSERPKGWDAVGSLAKTSVLNATSIPLEVKEYYQRSKMSAIIARVKRCVEKIHVVTDKKSAPSTETDTRVPAVGDLEMPSKSKNYKELQAESDEDGKNSSSEEYVIRDPKERRERAKGNRKRRNRDDDDESSDNEQPKRRKSKDELQRDALERHYKMCEAAVSTMQKMEELLTKLKNK